MHVSIRTYTRRCARLLTCTHAGAPASVCTKVCAHICTDHHLTYTNMQASDTSRQLFDISDITATSAQEGSFEVSLTVSVLPSGQEFNDPMSVATDFTMQV